jgi:hypothetical protein
VEGIETLEEEHLLDDNLYSYTHTKIHLHTHIHGYIYTNIYIYEQTYINVYLEGVEGIETLEEEHLPDDTGVVNSDKVMMMMMMMFT